MEHVQDGEVTTGAGCPIILLFPCEWDSGGHVVYWGIGADGDRSMNALVSRRIVHVVEMAKGGISTYVDGLIRHQVALGHDVHLVGCRTHGLPWFTDLPATLHAYNSTRKPWLLRPTLRQIQGILDDLQPHILHAHSSFAGLYTRLIRRPASCRLIYQPHGWSFTQDEAFLKRALYAGIERALAPRADVIVNISHAEAMAARQWHVVGAPNVTVRNGVCPSCPTGEPLFQPVPQKINLGFVGRFDRQKGLDLLIQAVGGNSSIHLWVVGDLSRDSNARPLEFPDNVSSLGWVPAERIDDFYSAIDALVVPSRWEGFGLVAAEAMRNGKPVITSGVGGLLELVIHGFNGYVVDFADCYAVSQLLGGIDATALRLLGANAQSVYDATLRNDTTFKAMDDLYLRLLA